MLQCNKNDDGGVEEDKEESYDIWELQSYDDNGDDDDDGDDDDEEEEEKEKGYNI